MSWKGAPSLSVGALQVIARGRGLRQSGAMILSLLLASAPLQATPPAPAATPGDPIEADWRTIPDDELLVMTLASGKQVIIRLAPRFAPAHVGNVRTLAHARWWDDASVYRVQENWVAQWGDATEKKPLPAGVTAAS